MIEAPVIGAIITASAALIVVTFNIIWDKVSKRKQYILENETIIEIIPHQKTRQKFLLNEDFKNGKSSFCNGLPLGNLRRKSADTRIHYFSVVNAGENLVKDLRLIIKINDNNEYHFFKPSFEVEERLCFSDPDWGEMHNLKIEVYYTSLANIQYKVVEELVERNSNIQPCQIKREIYIKKNLKKKHFKKISYLTVGHEYDTAYMNLKNFTADFSEQKTNKD